eukprot:316256_1
MTMSMEPAPIPNNDIIPCDICGENIKIEVYDQHNCILMIEPDPIPNNDAIPCDICGENIKIEAYDQHNCIVMLMEPDPIPNNDIIPCDICNENVKIDEYSQHNCNVTIPCEQCGTRVSMNEYREHINTAHSQRMIDCQYPNCDLKFRANEIGSHYIAHELEKDTQSQSIYSVIPCDLCDQKVQYDEYEEHQQQHKQTGDNEAIPWNRNVPMPPPEKIKLMRSFMDSPDWWREEDEDEMKYGEVRLTELDLNVIGGVAKEIKDRFYHTASDQEIIKIESVENHYLFDKFSNEKRVLLKLIGEQKLNQKYLFHGTRRDDIMTFVQKEGFRKEFTKVA